MTGSDRPVGRKGAPGARFQSLASMLARGDDAGSKLVYLSVTALSVVIVVFLFWLRPAFFDSVNLKALDAFFSMRGAMISPDSVVVVAVDEKSINEIGRWPWPRATTASLVEALAPARAVAVDMVFSEPESVEADSALSGAIERAGNVTLGYFFRAEATEDADEGALAELRRSRISLVRYTADSRPGGRTGLPVPWFDAVEANTAAIGSAASSFGFFNVIPDTDGLYRVANLLAMHERDIYPSLALVSAAHFLGHTQIVVSAASYGIDAIRVGPAKVPVDERGGFTINYYSRSPSFTTVSAVDVIEGRVPASTLEDRLVFVGVTETGIYDVRPTPLDSLYPGVEIHATVAANIIEGRYLVRDTRVVIFDLVMVLVLPLVLVFFISRFHSAFLCLATYLVLMAVFVIGEFLLFRSFSVVSAPVYPALSVTVAYLSAEAYRNIVVERRSRYLKKAFSSYVSSELVTELIRDPARLKLGGEKRPVTVLFSDIRGFTTIAEEMPAEELVRLLNEYLTPMTNIVLEEEGMLDKYIGDAIMAVFNTPVEVADHPAHACRAAMSMVRTLEQLNAGWARANYPRIDIGVGINTGEAVVGNMGAELRFDYTAIGDTVNLASRLEGMNKIYGTRIIVSAHTRDMASGEFRFRELDTVRVKGREHGIVIYELLSAARDATEADDELIKNYSAALALYRSGDFSAAREAFIQLADSRGDAPSRLFADRCEEYMKNPPADWDGMYVATSK